MPALPKDVKLRLNALDSEELYHLNHILVLIKSMENQNIFIPRIIYNNRTNEKYITSGNNNNNKTEYF